MLRPVQNFHYTCPFSCLTLQQVSDIMSTIDIFWARMFGFLCEWIFQTETISCILLHFRHVWCVKKYFFNFLKPNRTSFVCMETLRASSVSKKDKNVCFMPFELGVPGRSDTIFWTLMWPCMKKHAHVKLLCFPTKITSHNY